MATTEQLLQALQTVIDPNTGKDFVSTKTLKNLQVDGTDVSGLTFGMLAHIPGNVLKGNWRALAFVDERASPAQREALFNIMSGQNSAEGTLFHICSLIVTKMHEAIFAPITLEFDEAAPRQRIARDRDRPAPDQPRCQQARPERERPVQAAAEEGCDLGPGRGRGRHDARGDDVVALLQADLEATNRAIVARMDSPVALIPQLADPKNLFGLLGAAAPVALAAHAKRLAA